MNDRIRELAEQANKQIRHRICPNTFKPIDDPYGPHIRIEFDKEKFAELIVQECIRTIQLGITRDGQTTEKYLRSMRHIKDIKEHFGVE